MRARPSVFPVRPFPVVLVTRFGGNALVYGLVGAAYPAFRLVLAPVFGYQAGSTPR